MNLIIIFTLCLAIASSFSCVTAFIAMSLEKDVKIGEIGIGFLVLSAYLWWVFATLITIQ